MAVQKTTSSGVSKAEQTSARAFIARAATAYRKALGGMDSAKVGACQATHRAYATGILADGGKGLETQVDYGKRFGVGGPAVSEFRVLGKALDNGVEPGTDLWSMLSANSGATYSAVRKVIMAGGNADAIRKALGEFFNADGTKKSRQARDAKAKASTKGAQALAALSPFQRAVAAVKQLRKDLPNLTDEEAVPVLKSLAALVNDRQRKVATVVASAGGTSTGATKASTTGRSRTARTPRKVA